MLLVKTRIGVSSTHGIGLFAAEFIPKGTATWKYHPGFDLDLTMDAVSKLPEIPKKALLHYSYFDQELKRLIVPIDDLRFINHSQNLQKINITSTPNKDIAARDIEEGEELFCNYNMFDDTYFNRIGLSSENLV